MSFPLESLSITIIGYGSQGRSQALALKAAGHAPRIVLKPHSLRRALVQADGLGGYDLEKGVRSADLVMLLTPDEGQGELYGDLEPFLKQGAYLGFGHGYGVHFGLVTPRPDLNVFLVAPKVAGVQLLERGTGENSSWPVVVAVHQNPGGHTLEVAKAYARAVAGAEKLLVSTFQEEAITNLFSEQAVILGGVIELLRQGFNTLTQAGYGAEISYYECIDKIRLVGDLIHKYGLEGALAQVSRTAEWGARLEGPHVIDGGTAKAMEGVLGRIESGTFAQSLQKEKEAHFLTLKDIRQKKMGHLSEEVGKELRDQKECAKSELNII